MKCSKSINYVAATSSSRRSASWGVRYIQSCIMWRETVHVTSETGFHFKGRMYFCRIGFYSSTLLQAGSWLHKCSVHKVLMRVCLSLNDIPLCASHLFAFQAVCSHSHVQSSHCFQLSTFLPRHQYRPVWASSVTDSWMTVLKWALGILKSKEIHLI